MKGKAAFTAYQFDSIQVNSQPGNSVTLHNSSLFAADSLHFSPRPYFSYIYRFSYYPKPDYTTVDKSALEIIADQQTEYIFLGKDANNLPIKPEIPITSQSQKQDTEPIIPNKFFDNTDWILGVLLFSAIILTFVKLLHDKYLSNTIKAFFIHTYADKLFREQNVTTQRISLSLNAVFIISTSLFLYLLCNHYNYTIWDLNNFSLFLGLNGVIFSVNLVKVLVFRILGVVLLETKLFSEYRENIFLYNKAIGLCLFPITAGIAYMPQYMTKIFIYLGFIVVLTFYLSRIYQGLKIIITKRISIFYMILYLCTLEIIPFLLLFKYFNLLV